MAISWYYISYISNVEPLDVLLNVDPMFLGNIHFANGRLGDGLGPVKASFLGDYDGKPVEFGLACFLTNPYIWLYHVLQFLLTYGAFVTGQSKSKVTSLWLHNFSGENIYDQQRGNLLESWDQLFMVLLRSPTNRSERQFVSVGIVASNRLAPPQPSSAKRPALATGDSWRVPAKECDFGIALVNPWRVFNHFGSWQTTQDCYLKLHWISLNSHALCLLMTFSVNGTWPSASLVTRGKASPRCCWLFWVPWQWRLEKRCLPSLAAFFGGSRRFTCYFTIGWPLQYVSAMCDMRACSRSIFLLGDWSAIFSFIFQYNIY